MNSRKSYAAGVRRRRFVFVLVLVGSLATAGVAFAGTIADPGSSPFQVFGDAAGHPQSFTIVAQDFGEADAVSVEQCDGTDPTSASWSVTAHCDQGTATGIVLADVNGTATFPAGDPSVGFFPFKGASPSGQFNCLSPNQASPNNGLPDFKNCQIRVATSISQVTPDQAFATMTLPEPGGPSSTTAAPTTTTTLAPTTTTHAPTTTTTLAPTTTTHAPTTTTLAPTTTTTLAPTTTTHAPTTTTTLAPTTTTHAPTTTTTLAPTTTTHAPTTTTTLAPTTTTHAPTTTTTLAPTTTTVRPTTTTLKPTTTTAGGGTTTTMDPNCQRPGKGKGDKNHKHCFVPDDELDGALIVSRHHDHHGNRLVVGFGALLIAGVVFMQRRRLLIMTK